jgi:hypothetical protein
MNYQNLGVQVFSDSIKEFNYRLPMKSGAGADDTGLCPGSINLFEEVSKIRQTLSQCRSM